MPKVSDDQRQRFPIEHTCPDGSDRSRCACVRARKARRRQETPRRCGQPDCSRPHNARGLCLRHDTQARHRERMARRPAPDPVPAGAKRCGRCRVVKPLDHFHRHKGVLDGRTGHCRPCRLLDNRERLYGVTEAQIEALYVFQGGRCAIGWHGGALALDHCHDSGKVRGLLCLRHNKGLGFFDHDPAAFAEAVAYLLPHLSLGGESPGA